MNINFEDIPKHEVSDKALNNLKKVMYKQDEYGIKKYGEPLQVNQNFGWIEMFFEELADGLKYLQCEMERKEGIVKLLEAGLRSNEPKEYIEVALEVLKIGGTGK
jgi:translation elongation factor EF-1beta